ncbi:MAG: cysteine-rich CWC family protein [Burkholderiaceae bacterium]
MSVCPRCRTPFQCSVADGNKNEPCWCMALPPLSPARAASTGPADQCLCPTCLRQLTCSQEGERKDGPGSI